MANATLVKRVFGRILSEYGMLLVLLALCAVFSWTTLKQQQPTGADAAAQVAEDIAALGLSAPARVAIAVGKNPDDQAFADELGRLLTTAGAPPLAVTSGAPADARGALEQLAAAGKGLDAVACTGAAAAWPVWERLGDISPAMAKAVLAQPHPYRWPDFLKRDNLLNILNQIVVIAIIAIGMTMVIITGGIDLSVGSLIALSAVITALLIERFGATGAGVPAQIVAAIAAIAACAAAGLFTGIIVTYFGIPPFICTLGTMLVASGLAYTLSNGESIYQLPDSFTGLGRGRLGGLFPISVAVMLGMYVIAHIFMTRTRLGRYIYAAGGNRSAAYLSGLPIPMVLLFVYTISAALAGFGGVITASQLRSGSPTYGLMYELYVIAAVVVGGASLSGGEGKIFGTLIGAFIIAVIQNGMNLMGVTPYLQKIIFGLVILGAVLLDTLKRGGKMGWRNG